MREIWKDIFGYEGIYMISNLGRVKALKRRIKNKHDSFYYLPERIRKPVKDKNGYLTVLFTVNRNVKCFKIHRLVAEAFVKNPYKKPQVNHKLGIKSDNRATQLEWADNSDQQQHRYKILKQKGVNYGRFGRKNKLSKKIVQYSLNGKRIKNGTLSCVQRKLNLDTSGICKALNGKVKTCGGFAWKYYRK